MSIRTSSRSGAIVLAAMFLTACGSKDSASTTTAPKTLPDPPVAKEDTASFDPDKGLYLPDATKQSMGLVTATVQRKVFTALSTMKFQVFREADENPVPGLRYRTGYAYGSAILPAQKSKLALGEKGTLLEKGTADGVVKAFQFNPLPNSNQTECLVEIPDPKNKRVLGGFCDVQWNLSSIDAPTAISDTALLKTTEGDFVYVQKENRLARTAVKIGASGEGFTEITEGLASGDIVVTSPVQSLWLIELKLKSGGDS